MLDSSHEIVAPVTYDEPSPAVVVASGGIPTTVTTRPQSQSPQPEPPQWPQFSAPTTATMSPPASAFTVDVMSSSSAHLQSAKGFNGIDADAKAAIAAAEAEEEPVFLGDIMLSYVLAFLAWVMRNPKAFSCILVSVMLALFTKYAQDIVVQVVDLVVRAHPAVTPTPELRSKTSILANELRSMMNVARTTGAAWLGRGVVGGSLDSLVDTEFLNVPYALQTSFGGNALYFVYTSYLMNVTTSTNTTTGVNTTALHWGDCGCQYATKLDVNDYTTSTVIDAEGSPGAYCSYTDTNGYMNAFVGTNRSNVLMAPTPNMYSDTEDFITVIRGMTIDDQRAGGVWHSPTTYQDPLLNRTVAVFTYSYPLTFDSVTGLCTAAVSIDVDRDWFSTHLRTKTFYDRDVVMVGYGRSGTSRTSGAGDLRFVLENLHGSLMSSTSAFSTPLPRINYLVNIMSTYAQSTALGVLMQNMSFVENGLMYQSMTLMSNWLIIAAGPTADSTTEIGDAVMSLVTSFERSAAALKASQSLAVESCVQAIDGNRSSRFIRELSNLLKSFGPQVHGAYLAYPSGANGGNGICGCEQAAATFDTSIDVVVNGDALSQDCFAVLDNQSIVTFSNPRIPPASNLNNYTAQTFTGSLRNQFVRNFVASITSTNVTATSNWGLWSSPFPYYPTGANLMAFVLPLEFQKNATTGVENCTTAIVVEISLSIVPKLLTSFTRNGSSEVFWIDMETLQYMGSSSAYYRNKSYSWTSTPNATINNIMRQVSVNADSETELVNRLDALTLNGAAHPGGAVDQVINFARVFRPGLGVSVDQRMRWGLVEMLSATKALDEFYPVPSVTSSSQALALLPMDVNLRLFAVVLVLMIVFTLNLFVLGCSTVGEGPQPTWTLGITPHTASTTSATTTAMTPMPLLSSQTPMSTKIA